METTDRAAAGFILELILAAALLSVREVYGEPVKEIIIRGERPKQQTSRRSMDSADLKDTTGSMGDSLNALTIFPGVERTTGLTGDLVVRGVGPGNNRYFIDGIPLMYPLHFNGEHLVVSTDFLKGIDLYSSAFPVSYGGAIGAVLDITTEDSVKSFKGVLDINMISNSLFLKIPIANTVDQDTPDAYGKPMRGYVMFGGRYNGIKFILDNLLYKIMHPAEKRRQFENLTADYRLEYWDYQFKAEYFFNKNHSLSLLAIGAGDNEFRSIENDKDERNALMFHNQGLYYNYRSERVKNRLLVYSAWSERRLRQTELNTMYFFYAQNMRLRPYFGSKKSNPYQFGLKNSFEFEWIKKHAKLDAEIEYAYNHFDFRGSDDAGSNYIPNIETRNYGSLYITELHYPYRVNFSNNTIGGYLDNRFIIERFEGTIGARFDYLKRSNTVTVDPRASATYRFETDTTLSAAGGMYSSFYQNNPGALFNQDPLYARAHYAKPERAVHAALSVEQKADLYTFSLEGFYSYLHDLFETYPHLDQHGSIRIGANRGKMRSYGIEVLARKEKSGRKTTWFGLISYSLTHAKEKSGLFLPMLLQLDSSSLPNWMSTFDILNALYGRSYYQENMYWWTVQKLYISDLSGRRWVNAKYERRHSFKIILGLVHGNHTIAARFQLYSSFPYNSLVASYNPTGSGFINIPIYNPVRNTGHYPINHRLDIQYDYKKEYDNVSVRYYIGIMDVYSPLNNIINGYASMNPFYPYVPEINPKGYSNHESDGGFRVLGGIVPYAGVEMVF